MVAAAAAVCACSSNVRSCVFSSFFFFFFCFLALIISVQESSIHSIVCVQIEYFELVRFECELINESVHSANDQIGMETIIVLVHKLRWKDRDGERSGWRER